MKNDFTKLVFEAKDGDRESMEIVIKIMYPVIKKYGYKVSGEEIETDIIIHLIETIHELREEKLIDFNNGQMFGYLKSIIRNKSIDLLRKNRIQIDLVNYIEAVPLAKEDDYSHFVFDDLIRSLNQKQKKVIYYKYKIGMTDDEIGRLLGVSRQAVNQMINRAIMRLKVELSECIFY